MKKLILIALAGLFVIACQEKHPVRFTTSSAEIDSYKKGIDAYEKADWATWSGMFADTAKIYHNTWDNPSTAAEVEERHINTLSNLSSYGFDKDELQSKMRNKIKLSENLLKLRFNPGMFNFETGVYKKE